DCALICPSWAGDHHERISLTFNWHRGDAANGVIDYQFSVWRPSFDAFVNRTRYQQLCGTRSRRTLDIYIANSLAVGSERDFRTVGRPCRVEVVLRIIGQLQHSAARID